MTLIAPTFNACAWALILTPFSHEAAAAMAAAAFSATFFFLALFPENSG